MRGIAILLVSPTLLAGCANRSVNDVALGDVGQAYKVKFGTVLDEHPDACDRRGIDLSDRLHLGFGSVVMHTVITGYATPNDNSSR